MADIELYSHPENYELFQSKRPDYVNAVDVSLELANKFLKGKKNLVLADFCSGTGKNSLKFSKLNGQINKAILIDINYGFLDIAKKSGIKSKNLNLINQDILKVNLIKEADIVFSIFAYHHIVDKDKSLYIDKIKKVLKNDGILILTEIYLPNKEITKKYYNKLLNEIPKDSQINGINEFLQQTANSHDFEFKVSKEFADKQFEENGFKKVEEKKIWPLDNTFTEDIGTFVQLYRLD